MDEKLAKALGIRFVEKKKNRAVNVDVHIGKTTAKANGVRYTFSFSPEACKKTGEYVRVGIGTRRIYFVPSANCGESFKVNRKHSSRGYVYLGASAVGFIDEYIGDHKLRYDGDLDVYYIRRTEEEDA